MKALFFLCFVLSAVFAVEVIVSKPQQRVVLHCGVTSYKNLAWNHGHQLIQSVNTRGIPRRGTAAILTRSRCVQDRLEIHAVGTEDAGKFSCTADSKVKEFLLLLISVGSSPPGELQSGTKATLQCGVDGLSPAPTVQWTRPDGRPHPASGPVHLNPVQASDSGVWVCSFQHQSRTFNDSLHLRVEAPCRPTSAPPGDPEVQTPCKHKSCPPPGPTEPQVGVVQFQWWLWAAIGAGSFLVLLMLVSIVLLMRSNRKRKKKLHRVKSAPPQRPRQYCQCSTAAARVEPLHQKVKEPVPSLKPLLVL